MMSAQGVVLVVDDQADSRELLAEYLTLCGFDVATAIDGAEAIRQTERVHPTVVLMDLALPGALDGVEATRRIKLQPHTKSTIVIAVTARAFPTEQQRALHAGCAGVFTKPLDLAAVAAHLEHVLSGRQPT